MKIEIKPIVRPIHLRNYADVYGDETIWVWVNPPRNLRLEHYGIVQDFQATVDSRVETLKVIEALEEDQQPDPDLLAHLEYLNQQIDEISRRLYGWFAALWSKHDDEGTHWTADEIIELVETCMDSDPQLWDWIQEQLWRLITEHREGVRKN